MRRGDQPHCDPQSHWKQPNVARPKWLRRHDAKRPRRQAHNGDELRRDLRLFRVGRPNERVTVSVYVGQQARVVTGGGRHPRKGGGISDTSGRRAGDEREQQQRAEDLHGNSESSRSSEDLLRDNPDEKSGPDPTPLRSKRLEPLSTGATSERCVDRGPQTA